MGQNNNITCCCSQSKMETSSNQNISKPRVKSNTRRWFSSVYSVTVSLFIGLFPKCPVCWAAYMSIFGSYSISKMPYLPWLMPILIVLLGLHLYLIYRNIKNVGRVPFILSLVGAAIILGGRQLFPDNMPIIITGMSFILCGSLWNSFSMQRWPLINTIQES